MHVSDEDVCSDIAYSMYATRHGMTEEQVVQLWKSLGLYIASCLKCGKGVLLPALGTFYPASRKNGYKQPGPDSRSPCFLLQDRAFGAISQEASRAVRKGTIAQLNYNRIGTGLPFHRATVQRLVRELLSKLGSHILCNQLLQVHLAPVGSFIRRRGGRFRFQFDASLLAYLSGDAQAIELDKLLSNAQQQSAYHPQKGWPTGSPTPTSPTSQPPPSPTHSAYLFSQHPGAQPKSHASAGFNAAQGPQQLRPPSAAASAHAMHASAAAPMTPRSRGIATLRALCGAADWARNGRVDRLQMERWLNGECRALTSQLPATAIFDLLQTHAYGRAGSSVKYAPLLDALSAQLKQLHWEEASGLRQVPVIPTHPSGDMHMPASPTASQLYGMPGYQPHPQPHIFHAPAPGNWQVHPAAYPHYGGVSAAAQDLADQEPFPYFMQCDLAPRNRADCDAFNRFHFQRLAAVRQAAGGGVTPKVGNEPLTVYEAEYTRQVIRNRSASPMAPNVSRPLTAVPNGHRDISPGAAPPGFRPATAQPSTRRRSMSAAPERHHGGHPGDGEAAAQMHVGPEAHGYDGRRSAPLTTDRWAPSPAHFASAEVHAQHQHMYRASPDAQMGRASVPIHAVPQTLPCSPVNDQPAHGEDGMHPDKRVSFQAATAYPQHQHASRSIHPGTTAPPSPHPGTYMHSQGYAPGMQQAGASISFRADQWQEAQAAHSQATAQNFNRSPSPLQHTNTNDSNACAPQDMHAQQKHVFEVPDGLAEKIASGAFGEPVMQQRARGRSPVRADAGPGDENTQPWHRGDSSPVRSNRDPSPMKQLLSWNAPNQEYTCPRSHFVPCPETAESVRKSYDLQIQQRAALQEAYTQAESKWPYQPIHHPEARYAYFNGPRYIGPKHVKPTGCTSNRL